MLKTVATAALAGLLAVAAEPALMDAVVLTLPRALRAGEQLSVAVTVGAIGRQRVEVSTAGGEALGTISLFGVRAGTPGGTYTIPVPITAVHDGHLELRFAVLSGSERRPATASEVIAVRLLQPDG